MTLAFLTPEELARELGERLRAIRIGRGFEQAELAARAGVSRKTVGNLEQGLGSSVETLLRVLKALGSLEGIDALAPRPSINPLALLRRTAPPRRVRKRKAP